LKIAYAVIPITNVKTIRYPMRSLENMVSFIFEWAICAGRLIVSPGRYELQFLGNPILLYHKDKKMAFRRNMRVKPLKLIRNL
jgi:hypothetical protein